MCKELQELRAVFLIEDGYERADLAFERGKALESAIQFHPAQY